MKRPKYANTLALFVQQNWFLGKRDVLDGVEQWGRSADNEIIELQSQLQQLKTKNRLLESKLKRCKDGK